MKKVLLTGSGGTIGTVLSDRLPYDFALFDLPEHNAANYDDLSMSAKGCDAIIHLAWDTVTDNYKSDHMNPQNIEMAYNVYRAAVEHGISRVVMASSVNADRFTDRELTGLLYPYSLPLPNSPYGAGKVVVEALGRYYADTKHLGVVCLRFGNVNAADTPLPQAPDLTRNVWLSHEDCANLVTAAIEAPLPSNYEIIYGVSDNNGRIHDTSNTIEWKSTGGAH